jgi:hypothetical protein
VSTQQLAQSIRRGRILGGPRNTADGAREFAATDPIDSDELLVHSSNLGINVFAKATQAGTFSYHLIDEAGVESALPYTDAAPADTLVVRSLPFMPRLIVRFTPDAATAGNVWVDAYGFGGR